MVLMATLAGASSACDGSDPAGPPISELRGTYMAQSWDGASFPVLVDTITWYFYTNGQVELLPAELYIERIRLDVRENLRYQVRMSQRIESITTDHPPIPRDNVQTDLGSYQYDRTYSAIYFGSDYYEGILVREGTLRSGILSTIISADFGAGLRNVLVPFERQPDP